MCLYYIVARNLSKLSSHYETLGMVRLRVTAKSGRLNVKAVQHSPFIMGISLLLLAIVSQVYNSCEKGGLGKSFSQKAM